MSWTIYCHKHIETGRCYIGLTKLSMMKRWNQHLQNANKKKGRGCAHFWNAIRKYGKEAFAHEVLEKCSILEVANLAEECWVEFFDTRNPEKGFNLSRGGAHVPHPIRRNPWDDPEFRERNHKNILKLIEAGNTPETRAKSKAALNTSECRAKRSSLTKSAMARPEVKAKYDILRSDPNYSVKISESLKVSLASEESRTRMSEAAKASATPEVRLRRSKAIKEAFQDPVVQGRHRAAVVVAQNRPELIERRRSYRASPETLSKISVASTGRRHSSESVQKQRDLYLQRSSSCKFCDSFIEGKRTCINGRVSCQICYGLHKAKLASFFRPDRSFI